VTKVSSGAGFWRQGRSARTAHRLASEQRERALAVTVPPSITYDSVAGIGTSWDVGGDHGNELRSHSGEQDGQLQWDGDADELERDQYRRAGVERSDLLVSALVRIGDERHEDLQQWHSGAGSGERDRGVPILVPDRAISRDLHATVQVQSWMQCRKPIVCPFSIKGKAFNIEPG